MEMNKYSVSENTAAIIGVISQGSEFVNNATRTIEGLLGQNAAQDVINEFVEEWGKLEDMLDKLLLQSVHDNIGGVAANRGELII